MVVSQFQKDTAFSNEVLENVPSNELLFDIIWSGMMRLITLGRFRTFDSPAILRYLLQQRKTSEMINEMPRGMALIGLPVMYLDWE